MPIAKKLQFGPIFCFWVPARVPEAVLGCYGLDAERGWIWRGAGLTRCSARVLLGRGAWVLSGYRAKVLPGCGIVMWPHCRARELFGRGIVMWPECGVAKHGRCRGFGRLPVYRVVLLLSLKISNATLLKLVFRYNGRREFVEEQARSPPMSNLLDTPKLGFGCMRLPLTDPKDQKSIDIEHLKKMVDAFIEAGGTYFDTAYVYHEGESEVAMRKALVERYPRDSFTIATKCLAWAQPTAEDAKACLDTSLKRLGTDYIDFYLLHNMGGARTAKFDEYGMWEWAAQKKAEGVIKHLGFSMHDNAETLDKLLADHPDMDFVQLQVNYLDWEDPVVESRKCMEVAQKHGVPVVIMEPARGGRLADLPERGASVLKSADPDKSVVSWAYRFCYNLPNVISVLSGVSTLEQIQENVREWKANEPLSAFEEKALGDAVDALKSVGLIPCTNCRYCVKDCPAGVKIPEALGLLNLEKVTENREFAKSQYAWQTRDGRASACIQCGACEDMCPQGINIIELLEDAADFYE